MNKFDKGQTLVLFTLLFFGFVAMLALVIDGGYAYYTRRIAQDAADAAALAGAKVYCIDGKDVNNSKDTALIYAAANGADPGSREDIIINTVEPYSVTANTSVEFNTFFANLLGRPSAIASASATAGCLPPTQAAPLPIAVLCNPDDDSLCGYQIWDPAEHGGQLEPVWYPYQLNAEGEKEPIEAGGPGWDDEAYYYIVMESNSVPDPSECQPIGPLVCDLDGDGTQDIFGGGSRGWVDLDGGGGGASELWAYINGSKTTTIHTHYWIADAGGGKTSTYQEIIDQVALGHDSFVIPIYNILCKGDPSDPGNGCEYHLDKDVVVPGGEGTKYFHIHSFAMFKVTCVRKQPKTSCPVFDYLVEYDSEMYGGLDDNTRSIEGYFIPATSEDLDAILSGMYYGTGTYVIKLID